MNINQTQKKADALREEAKNLWARMLGLPENCGSGSADMIIDCIISCAILEVAITQNRAREDLKKTAPPSSPFFVSADNPNVTPV